MSKIAFVGDVLQRTLGNMADTLTLSQMAAGGAVAAATAATVPAAAIPAAWPLLAAFGVTTGVAWLQSKRAKQTAADLDGQLAAIQDEVRQQAAARGHAADRIAVSEEVPTSDLDPDDPIRPYLILYRYLHACRKDSDAQRQAIAEELRNSTAVFEAVLDGNATATRDCLTGFTDSVRELQRDAAETQTEVREVHALLREHDEAAAKQHAELLDTLKQANGPPLCVPELIDTQQNRFKFAARRISLLDRREELAELHAFLSTDDPGRTDFSWWLWTGPGGIGKSRLALDLCLQLISERKWHAGFLDHDAPPPDWSRLHLEKPTLIVVDYVALDAVDLGKAVRTLSSYYAKTPGLQPLRLLLLEREAVAQSRWVSDLLGTDGSTDEGVTLSTGYTSPTPAEPTDDRPLEPRIAAHTRPLRGLSDDAVWDALREAAAASEFETDLPADRRDEWVAAFADLDPHRRPLLAAFAGEAIADRSATAITQMDAEELTRRILRRDIELWQRHHFDLDDAARGRHLDALTLSTLIGGVDWDDFPRYAPEHLDADHVLSEVVRDFVGWGTVSRSEVPPLEPDLLGELFVLERLRGQFAQGVDANLVRRRSVQVLKAAWSQAPARIGEFIKRATTDWPQHEAIDRLAIPTAPVAHSVDRREHLSALHAVDSAFRRLASTQDPSHSSGRFELCTASLRVALALVPKSDDDGVWAITQNNLGITLSEQAVRSEPQKARTLLQEAADAYRAALTVHTRERLPQDWAMTQNNLGTTLQEQALRSEPQEARTLLQEAAEAYRAALTVHTRERLPQPWATTQYNLWAALLEHALRSEPQEARTLLQEAAEAYRAALTVRTRERLPQNWAATQNNLAITLQEQALRSEPQEARTLLSAAIDAHDGAAEVYTPQTNPHNAAIVQRGRDRAQELLDHLNNGGDWPPAGS